MPQPTEIEAEQVHVLEATTVRRSRTGLIVGLVLLAAVAGAGVWVAVADPFAARTEVATAPPAADNLLGDAWSFETTETAGPSERWRVPDEAPGGFVFTADAAVSGQAGARAESTDAGWVRMLSAESWRLGTNTERLELSATSLADGVQLLLRFEAEQRPAIDVVIASGQGAIAGVTRTLPGYTHVRAGIAALGEGALDDVSLRQLAAGESPVEGATVPAGQLSRQGVFDVYIGDPPGLSVFRGDELALRIEPAFLATPGGELPSIASSFPGEGAIALADGSRLPVRLSVTEANRQLVVRAEMSGVPAGTRFVHSGLLAGSLAEAPLGVRSARGYEQFAGDFRVENVDALVLGRTQDRLVLEMGAPFTLAATHRSDGSVALQLEIPAEGTVTRQLVLQAEFKEERVTAAQLRDAALADEGAGRLGSALALLDRIASEYPYDEQVLATALAARARIQAGMQQRLDALDADLEDSLFLGSASRCREVRNEALAAAAVYKGSEAEALFAARAASVEERAARLLEEDLERRRGRLEALADSFEGHGDYPLVSAELRDYLARFLTADGDTP